MTPLPPNWLEEARAKCEKVRVTKPSLEFVAFARSALPAALDEIARLRAALHKIAYEPIGMPEATLQEVYDGMTQTARDALAQQGGA